jgi:hypothetical protein
MLPTPLPHHCPARNSPHPQKRRNLLHIGRHGTGICGIGDLRQGVSNLSRSLHQRTAPVNNAATWLPASNGWVPGAITNKALAARNDNKRLEPWAPVVVATS